MAGNELKFDYIPVDKIDVSPLNVRRAKPDESLDELAESIKEIGVQQPVVVFQAGDRYKLIIGQRRYLACRKIGKKEIPALIMHEMPEEMTVTLASFSENIHRLDLDYKDKMQVAVELSGRLGSVDEVARRLGVSAQTVRNYLGYAAVPDRIKEMVSQQKLSATTATRIALNIPDEKKAIEVAEKVSEVPRSEDRIRIIEITKENPTKTVAEVVDIANNTSFAPLTLDLTPTVAQALERACTEYKSEREAIATWALEEWLKSRGFLG